MTCGECGKREAVVTLTQVVEGEARTVGLCETCAAEKGIQTAGSAEQTPLGGFLSALWKGTEPGGPGEPAATGKCSGCGATFADFRETGRLGCAECYRTFEPALRVLLRRYHGSTHHHGRRQLPVATTGAEAQADLAATLKEQLRLAIGTENFELAAELRDRLRDLP
ncbi:MAG: UvrB/UvrC motif-containing protein [Gemmatimonadota bacterium]|jgi:protein arginine kinase activator|nr:UvrB/UvrC motif-containing protein [Gemmatimonadota bacterium]